MCVCVCVCVCRSKDVDVNDRRCMTCSFYFFVLNFFLVFCFIVLHILESRNVHLRKFQEDGVDGEDGTDGEEGKPYVLCGRETRKRGAIIKMVVERSKDMEWQVSIQV